MFEDLKEGYVPTSRTNQMTFEENADGPCTLNIRPYEPVGPTNLPTVVQSQEPLNAEDETKITHSECSDYHSSALDSEQSVPGEHTHTEQTEQWDPVPTIRGQRSSYTAFTPATPHSHDLHLFSTPGLNLRLNPSHLDSSQSLPLAMRLLSLKDVNLGDDLD